MIPVRIERQLDLRDTPLGVSLQTLLKGPSTQELAEGLVSLIPPGSVLRSAWVRDGIAFLNFNEEFMFNPFGSQGLKAQLRQVVYTATEFSTVRGVQILIDGQTRQFLGGDNIAIGEVLNRTNMP